MTLNKDMEKNIFEGAKFGDKFLTRDGRISLFIKNLGKICRMAILNQNDSLCEYRVETNSGILFQNGKVFDAYPCNWDIVSKYQKPIDEEKLDKLVFQNCYIEDENRNIYLRTDIEIYDAFKAGYCKAKEK